MSTTNRRRWAGRFTHSSSTCDLVFVDDVDNGADTDPSVDETLFQLRVEEGERPDSREGVLILSILLPGGEIHHRGFTAQEARRVAADLLESASLVDTYNRSRTENRARPLVAAGTIGNPCTSSCGANPIHLIHNAPSSMPRRKKALLVLTTP